MSASALSTIQCLDNSENSSASLEILPSVDQTQHTENSKNSSASSDNFPPLDPVANPAKLLHPNPPSNSKSKTHCHVCDIDLVCIRNFNQHLKGRKHQKKLEKLNNQQSDETNNKNPSKSTPNKSNKRKHLNKVESSYTNAMNNISMDFRDHSNSWNFDASNRFYTSPGHNRYSYNYNYRGRLKNNHIYYNNPHSRYSLNYREMNYPNSEFEDFGMSSIRYVNQKYSFQQHQPNYTINQSINVQNNTSSVVENCSTFCENPDTTNNSNYSVKDLPLQLHSGMPILFNQPSLPIENIISHQKLNSPPCNVLDSNMKSNNIQESNIAKKSGNKIVDNKNRGLSLHSTKTKVPGSSPETLRKQSTTNEDLCFKPEENTSSILKENHSDGEKKNPETFGKIIANWIHPLNPKHVAETERLLTDFSKSKRKESLLRLKLLAVKNHASASTSNDSEAASVAEVVEHAVNTTEASNENQNVTPLHDIATNKAVNIKNTMPKITRKQQQRGSNKIKRLTNRPLPKGSPKRLAQHFMIRAKKQNSTSLENNISELLGKGTDEKKSGSTPKKNAQSRTIKGIIQEIVSVNDGSKLLGMIGEKRKSIPGTNNTKRHRCSSSECLEECSATKAISEQQNILQQKDIPEIPTVTPFDSSVRIKEEPIGSNEMIFSIPSTSSGNFSKSSDIDPNNVLPVDSLITLFASGEVKVKKELDDPVIDAIRTIDPNVLNTALYENSLHRPNEVNANSILNESLASIRNTSSKPNFSTIKKQAISKSQSSENISQIKAIHFELRAISNSEEELKKRLEECEKEISQYQQKLDALKIKKTKYQVEEESIRTKRNMLLKQMDALLSSDVQNTSSMNASNENIPSPVAVAIKKEIDSHEVEEVVFLDSSNTNSIPIVNLSDSEEDYTSKVLRNKPETDILIDTYFKEIECHVIHQTIVNHMEVFDGYLYSCSNDSTAKRFNLKDFSESVTYQHSEKNVLQICVNKFNATAIVFTFCSNSHILLLFNAKNGVLINKFTFDYNISSICKGWGTVYVGLKNGNIISCTSRNHKILVNAGEPIKQIASSAQGGVHLLITLSTDGNVSIRDIQNQGLLLRYVKAQAHLPQFMVIYNDFVYLSSPGFLTIMDISNSHIVKKIKLSGTITSFSVHNGIIFTATFSGMVKCFPEKEETQITSFYGAGKVALTSIHVFQGWVFTGNRKGEMSAFKFNSATKMPCQMKDCTEVYGILKDLEAHVLDNKGHSILEKKSNCLWKSCRTIFPKSIIKMDICNHYRKHIYEYGRTNKPCVKK